MNEQTRNSYDQVPYISQAFANTQPYHLAVIATLFGLSTPSIENARVLEIGCSFGGNIIPFAIANPQAEIIGLDLAQVQVNAGNQIIQQLGLKNIKLRQQDISDYQGDLGKFDYIICHGVFSWVPQFVQDKIIDMIKSSLKEDGLAVISYNTNPGWKNISILRDMMMFRTKFLQKQGVQMDSSELLVDYGKKAVDFLQEYSVLGQHLSSHINNLKTKTTHYLFHEYFETFNQAFYLYDFNTMLEEKGLMHLSDSDINKTIPIYSHQDKKINMDATLENECLGDRIAKEQYYDYLCDQQFRSSIIGHKDKIEKAKVSKNIKCENLDKLYIRLKDGFKKLEDGSYQFSHQTLSKDYQWIIEKLVQSYPNTMSIKELYALSQEEEQQQMKLYTQALFLIYNKFVETFVTPMSISLPEKPCLKAGWKNYFNYFINTDNPVISLASFNGIIINIEKFQLQLLSLLDGTQTEEDLIKILLKAKEKGEINISNVKCYEDEVQAIKHFIDSTLLFAQKYHFID